MAIPLKDKENVLPPSPGYPFGDILDDTGANDGTPVNRSVYADFHQFFAKLAFESGIVLNGVPDNESNGFQYFEALSEFKNKHEIARNGTFGLTQTSTISFDDTLASRNRVTSNKDSIYVMSVPSPDVIIQKINKNDIDSVVGTISKVSNPEYNGEARDVFFDKKSGFLYVLFTTGSSFGFTVYDSDLVYQPSLSNTNTGLQANIQSIWVRDVVRICGKETSPTTEGIRYRYDKSDGTFIGSTKFPGVFLGDIITSESEDVEYFIDRETIGDNRFVTYFNGLTGEIFNEPIPDISSQDFVFTIWDELNQEIFIVQNFTDSLRIGRMDYISTNWKTKTVQELFQGAPPTHPSWSVNGTNIYENTMYLLDGEGVLRVLERTI